MPQQEPGSSAPDLPPSESQALDPTLVARLWRRAEQPGVVDLRPARALADRHRRIVSGLPLADLVTRHTGAAGYSSDTVPLVYAQPSAPAPPSVTPTSPPPTASSHAPSSHAPSTPVASTVVTSEFVSPPKPAPSQLTPVSTQQSVVTAATSPAGAPDLPVRGAGAAPVVRIPAGRRDPRSGPPGDRPHTGSSESPPQVAKSRPPLAAVRPGPWEAGGGAPHSVGARVGRPVGHDPQVASTTAAPATAPRGFATPELVTVPTITVAAAGSGPVTGGSEPGASRRSTVRPAALVGGSTGFSPHSAAAGPSGDLPLAVPPGNPLGDQPGNPPGNQMGGPPDTQPGVPGDPMGSAMGNRMSSPMGGPAAGSGPVTGAVASDRNTATPSVSDRSARSDRPTTPSPLDIEHIVDTVHRRFVRRMAIETERRAMR